MKKVKHLNKIFQNKKIIIVMSVLVIIAVITLGILVRNQTKNVEKMNAKREEENNVQLNVEIKKETETAYECLLTFISNDENNKIEKIECPNYDGKENQVINNSGEKQKIAMDYKINKDDEEKIFNIVMKDGNVINKKTSYTIICEPNNNGETVKKNKLVGTTANLDIPKKEGYIFLGWSKEKNSDEGEYFKTYNYNNEDVVNLYGKWIKSDNNSIIGAVKVMEKDTKFAVEQEAFSADLVKYDGDLILDGETDVEGAALNNKIYEFGNKETDVATEKENAKNMVVLKVNGNLTIEEGVTLTACKSDNGYGGPKGLLIYCTGILTNNGTVDMTSRGAKAKGQNVYLWQNEDESYEYIPAVGANGGQRKTDGIGNNGNNGVDRQTGGGASGGGRHYINSGTGGAGASGTSYSGGTGGGGGTGTSSTARIRWRWR